MENLSLSVLVLDYNPASLLTISKMLAKFNFKVLPFQTAEAALDSLERGAAKDEKLDLVLAEVHLGNTAVGTLALFHHILNELKVPLITMCAYHNEEAVSECMALGACFHVLKPLDAGTFNILKQKALQHSSRRMIPEGSSIIKETKSSMDSSSAKMPNRRFILESSNLHRSETEEDEEQDACEAPGHAKKLGRFTWDNEVHEKFLQAVKVLGDSAKPGKIRRQMNVKNLTSQQIASHLQKYRRREKRAKQGGQDQENASMKPVSELTTSVHNAATSKPINQPTTTQMPITPRVAAASREMYPRTPWIQLEENPAEAAASKTNARASAIFGDDTKSVWDKYQKTLENQNILIRELPAPYKLKLLPMESQAVTKDGDIAVNMAGEKGHGASASAPPESLGSSSMLTSVLSPLGKNGHTEAAGNNGNLENVTLHEDTNKEATAAMGAHGVVDPGSNALLADTHNKSTAQTGLSDPFAGLEDLDPFWATQLEEPQNLAADDLLQGDNAWFNHPLQPASLANMEDAPMAHGDAPAYDPAQQFTIGDIPVYDPAQQFTIEDAPVHDPAPIEDAPAYDPAPIGDAPAYAPAQQFTIGDAPAYAPTQQFTIGDALTYAPAQQFTIGDAPTQQFTIGDAPTYAPAQQFTIGDAPTYALAQQFTIGDAPTQHFTIGDAPTYAPAQQFTIRDAPTYAPAQQFTIGDAPTQQFTIGDALTYAPAQQFTIGDASAYASARQFTIGDASAYAPARQFTIGDAPTYAPARQFTIGDAPAYAPARQFTIGDASAYAPARQFTIGDAPAYAPARQFTIGDAPAYAPARQFTIGDAPAYASARQFTIGDASAYARARQFTIRDAGARQFTIGDAPTYTPARQFTISDAPTYAPARQFTIGDSPTYVPARQFTIGDSPTYVPARQFARQFTIGDAVWSWSRSGRG